MIDVQVLATDRLTIELPRAPPRPKVLDLPHAAIDTQVNTGHERTVATGQE